MCLFPSFPLLEAFLCLIFSRKSNKKTKSASMSWNLGMLRQLFFSNQTFPNPETMFSLQNMANCFLCMLLNNSISMYTICMYPWLLTLISYQSICFFRMKWCLILLCILCIMLRYNICLVNLVQAWSMQEWGWDEAREILWPFRENNREVKSKGQ